jgi:hypothetical protein
MSDSLNEQDPLNELKNNREAIENIKALYIVDDDVAIELWSHFIETVRKMRTISQPKQSSQSEGK